MIENKIYMQYKILLEKTNQLSHGDFDIQIEERKPKHHIKIQLYMLMVDLIEQCLDL